MTYFHKTAFCISAILQSLKFYLYFWSENQCFKAKERELSNVILNNCKSNMIVFISMFPVNILNRDRKKLFKKIYWNIKADL